MPKKRTQYEILAAFEAAHGDRYGYQLVKYLNSTTKVQIVCRIHGIFDVLPAHHTHGVGCRFCYFESNRKGRAHFLKQSAAAHGDQFDYSMVPETLKSSDKVPIRCKVHDRWFEQLASAHVHGHVGCNDCLSNKLSGPAHLRGKLKSDDVLLSQFVTRAIAVHGNTFSYERFVYQGAAKKGEIICNLHGSFNQTPNNHLRGCSCPQCANEAKHRDSFKAECERTGIDYWSALKRREAGMSAELVMSTTPLRSERRINAITIHGVTYPNMEAAVRQLNPVASSPTIARWIAAGVTPEDAFWGVPNPGHANGVIYVLVHEPTGKQYVGLTIVPVRQRWLQHIEQAQAGHIKSLDSLHAAIRTHGPGEFTLRVIDRGTAKRDLEGKERHWIAKLETLVPKGFNISRGGGSGGAMGRTTVVEGQRFATVREAAVYVARMRGITFVAAKGRLRSGRLDVVAPSKPGHAISKTSAYKAWSRIVHCATNPQSKDFIPGLALHPGWYDFHIFLNDVGQPPERGLVFARLDKGKGFTPDNCVWMGKSEASQRNAAQMKAAGKLVGRGRQHSKRPHTTSTKSTSGRGQHPTAGDPVEGETVLLGGLAAATE